MAKKKSKKVSKRCKSWNERVNNLTYHDLKHIKLGAIAFAFFLVAVWEGLRVWLGGVHWAWFLALMILFSIKPMINFWKK
jgi:hypothetical protein